MNSKKITISVHSPDANEKFFFFMSGVIISIPISLFFEAFGSSIATFTSQLLNALWAAAFVSPLVEEFAKSYPLFYRHGETGKSIYMLGFLVGLGFGVSEFFVYVFAYGAPILLRVPGILFHAASTTIVSYGIATKIPFSFYIVAVLFHAINNLFAQLGELWLIGGIGAITATYLLSIYYNSKLKDTYY